MSWELVYTKQAKKDAQKLKSAGLKPQAERVFAILQKNPFQPSPPCEKLVGDLEGAYSRRISIQRRIVYQVLEDNKIIKVLRMWTHYE